MMKREMNRKEEKYKKKEVGRGRRKKERKKGREG
jgi:hypothetical protein